jgi:hypothetical protein
MSNELKHRPLGWRDLLVALLIGGAALSLYVRTLAPFLLPSDSGEFQVLVHQLGLAHTTGYSTYLILGHLFERSLPLGDVAYRVNLFSAVMAALAVALVYAAATVLTGKRLAGAVAALCLAVGFTFWSQAVIAEVYSTGAAFTAAVLLLVLLWLRTGARWPIFAAALLGGVGLGAHSSLGLLGIAVAAFLLLHWPRRHEWLLAGLLGVLVGVALYAGGMLLVDARAAPADIFNVAYAPSRSKWGLSEADIANPLVRTWFLASAGQWRSALFNDPLVDSVTNTLGFAVRLGREYALPALLLALAGAILLLRREWRTGAFLLGALALQIVIYANYDVGDRYVFFIPSYILLALLLAEGVGGVLRWVAARTWGTPAVQLVLAVALALLCVVPLVLPQWGAIRRGDVPFQGAREYLVNGDTRAVARLAPQVTAALEPDAILITDWYWLWPYTYAAHILQGEQEMRFVETYPRADTEGAAASLREYIAANVAVRPVYVTARDQSLVPPNYQFRPVRLGPVQAYRLEPRP